VLEAVIRLFCLTMDFILKWKDSNLAEVGKLAIRPLNVAGGVRSHVESQVHWGDTQPRSRRGCGNKGDTGISRNFFDANCARLQKDINRWPGDFVRVENPS